MAAFLQRALDCRNHLVLMWAELIVWESERRRLHSSVFLTPLLFLGVPDQRAHALCDQPLTVVKRTTDLDVPCRPVRHVNKHEAAERVLLLLFEEETNKTGVARHSAGMISRRARQTPTAARPPT